MISIFLASILPRSMSEKRVIEISPAAFIAYDLLTVILIKATLLFFLIFLMLGISSFLYRPPTDN